MPRVAVLLLLALALVVGGIVVVGMRFLGSEVPVFKEKPKKSASIGRRPTITPPTITITRHPTIEAPDAIVIGKRFPVQFWLTEELITPKVRVKAPRGKTLTEEGLPMELPKPSPGSDYWDLDVILWAPGFDLGGDGEWNRSLRLYPDGDSAPLAFLLVARAGAAATPDRRLYFRLYHQGRFLGSASRSIVVRDPAAAEAPDNFEADKPTASLVAGPSELKSAIRVNAVGKAPDMQVVILYEHDANGVPVSGHIDILSRHRPGHIVSKKFAVNPGITQWLTDTYARFVALGSQVRGAMTLDGDSKGTAPSKAEAIHVVRTRGRHLYDHHVPEAFKKYFWTLARMDKERKWFKSIQITTNDPRLPWELLRPVSEDGETKFDFLGLEFDVARWALRESSGQRDLPPREMLFSELPTIAPSYKGRNYLPFQKVELDALSKIAGFRKIAGDFESIEALMKRPIDGIVHFTGHGEVTDPGTGRPVFAIRLQHDRTLGADAWPSLAAAGRNPFFFFNACDTGRSRALGGFVQGWGPTLLASGASGFIGGLWPLLDKAAAAFSADFYGRFARRIQKGPVRMANLLSAIRRRFLETGDPTYLAYTFYGDVNFRFYTLPR